MTLREFRQLFSLLAAAVLVLLPLLRSAGLAQTVQPKHSPELQALINKAYQANRDGNFNDGLRLYGDVFRRARELKDEDGEGWGFAGQAYAYEGLGQTQNAMDSYEKARLLYNKVGNKEGEVFTLNSMGGIKLAAAQPNQAIPLYQLALIVTRGTANGQATAVILHNLGRAFQQDNEKSRAIEALMELLSLQQKAGDQKEEASVLVDIGNVNYDLGEQTKALASYTRALQLYKDIKDQSGEAILLGNIGFYYRSIRQPENALKFHRQALQEWIEMQNVLMQAKMLTQIGADCTGRNHPGEAIEADEKALTLHRSIKNVRGEADTLSNLGQVYAGELGQLQRGLVLYQQALSLHRANGNRRSEAITLSNIGNVYAWSGHPKQAIQQYIPALAILKELGDRHQEGSTLVNIALSEISQGHIADADKHAAEAVACLEKLRANLGGYDDAKDSLLESQISTYYLHAWLLLRLGRPEEAFSIVQKTKARSLLDLMTYGRVNISAALTPEERGQEQELRQQADLLNTRMVKEGVENEIGAKKRFADLQAQLRSVEGQLQTLTDTLYASHPNLASKRVATTCTLSDVGRFLPHDTALLEYIQMKNEMLSLFVVTSDKGMAKLQVYSMSVNYRALAKRCAVFRATIADPRKNYRFLARDLYNLLVRPAEKALAGKKRLLVCPDGPLWDVPFQALTSPRIYSRIRNRRRRKSTFLAERFEISYAYSATGAQAVISARRNRRRKPAGSLLVFANPDFGSSSRFGDLNGLAGQRPLDSPARPFEAPSRPFDRPSRPFVSPSRPVESPSRPIVRPSRPIESASRPFVSPSRPIDSPSRPIVRPSRPIESASRPIVRPSRPIDSPSRPIAVASRTFDALSRGGRIAPLPGTQREADALKADFPSAAVYTGSNAQESTAKLESGKYRYLRFATHGFINDASPLLSAIVLAQPRPPVPNSGGVQDDGFLTAREIFDLDLAADMVVLSACNTARGVQRDGDGVIGLTWALFVAGCPTQVVSQWAVDDASTATHMKRFYAGIAKGKPKGESLRHASLSLFLNRKSKIKNRKYAHPYYWAPFILMGDWR